MNMQVDIFRCEAVDVADRLRVCMFATIPNDAKRLRQHKEYMLDPQAHGMSIDLCSTEWLRSHVPEHMHSQFTAIGSLNIQTLDYAKLESLIREAWGIGLDCVDVIHHLPMCESLSGASCDHTQLRT